MTTTTPSAPTPGAQPGDPPGARLAFCILGDNGACTRFLVVVVVIVLVIAGTLVGLALVAPALATTLTSALMTIIGGRAGLRWWRSRPPRARRHRT